LELQSDGEKDMMKNSEQHLPKVKKNMVAKTLHQSLFSNKAHRP